MKFITRRDALKVTAAGVGAASNWMARLASKHSNSDGPLTEVRQKSGRPQFFVDGQPFSKPVFETYVPESKYFQQFSDAGNEVFSFSTNLGLGFGVPVWIAPDQWSFEALDAIAHRVLEANPRGLLMPRIYLTTPNWWAEANLAECQVLAHGGQHYRQGVGHGRDGKAFPSLASAKWRNDTAAALQRVIQHMQDSDYGSHLFGYMVTGLMSEEWYHWSIHSDELSDYSSHALQAFRAWLRNKYLTSLALSQAWNEPDLNFERVAIPTQAVREAGRNKLVFRDPQTQMPVIDWYLFYNDLVPDTMDVFLRAAKEASNYRKVVGAFYCYMFEFGGDPEYGHNAMGRLLRSKYLDFALVTASYHNRSLGAGADYARAPITSVGLHGKLWYHDNDTVSFRYDEMNRANADRATVERYRAELGVTETAEETIWQYRRGTGFVLGNGTFQSFFDLHGGYFDDPKLMAEVKRLNSLLDEARKYDNRSVAEILVVSDEVSCSYATFQSAFMQQTLQPIQVQLAKLGAPHDSILVDDLALVNLARYKFVIFLNCFHLTDSQRELIQRTVLNHNRWVMWCYAPGLFNEQTQSDEAMHQLTGIRIVPGESNSLARLRIKLNRDGARLLEGTATDGTIIGHEHVWGMSFSVQDSLAKSLGIIERRSEVALATKRLTDWTSVYTVNPVLPAALLRGFARQAGVHIYNRLDDTFYASRSYMCLNADGGGERTIRFPEPVDLFEPFTGELLASQVNEYSHLFVNKETLLIRCARF